MDGRWVDLAYYYTNPLVVYSGTTGSFPISFFLPLSLSGSNSSGSSVSISKQAYGHRVLAGLKGDVAMPMGWEKLVFW